MSCRERRKNRLHNKQSVNNFDLEFKDGLKLLEELKNAKPVEKDEGRDGK
tara:strand:+ start:193 stop:342 length:150 start_codon:yes stop_codon:yes gene_type:complete